MNKSQLQKLIREEVKGALSEGNALEDKVAYLYGFAGVKTQYSDRVIEKFGKKTVDLAIQMAPKLIAYETSLKKIVKEMEKSPEAKMLLNAMEAMGDGRSSTTLGDLVNRYTKR
jgi:hypothetical protein